MKAVIGIDGSQGAWEAVRQAARLLGGPGDRALLYYAPPKVRLSGNASPPELRERTQALLSESVFAEAKKRLPAELARTAQTISSNGDPRKELPALAEDHNADLIVVGARGLGPIEGFLVGSVSRTVARLSHRPVLVARAKRDKASESTFKVLFPLDAVPASERTTELLAAIRWPQKSSGRLMHVVESVFGDQLPDWLLERAEYAKDEQLARAYLKERETLMRDKFQELSDYRGALPAVFADAPPVVLEGYPAERILETARADDVDLIVLGAKEVSRLERFMLGSTAERVLSEAPCSVLLVHHR